MVTGTGCGLPLRQLGNRMAREYMRMEAEETSWREIEKAVMDSIWKAAQEGDVINGTIVAGQAAGIITKEAACAEIIQEIMSEIERLFNK